MNDINLLSPSQKQKRIALSFVTYITIGFFIMVISMGGFALTLTTIQLTINDRSSQYSDQITALDRQIKAYSGLETDVSSINQNLTAISTVLSGQLAPNDLLSLLSSKINANLTATSIGLSQATTADGLAAITISGTAKDRDSIIAYKRQLETIPKLQNVVYTITAGGTGKTDSTAATKDAAAAGFGFTVTTSYQKATK